MKPIFLSQKIIMAVSSRSKKMQMLRLLVFIASTQCINTKTLDPISDAMFSNYDKSFRFQEASVRGLGPCECEVRIFFPSIVVAFSPLTLKTIIAVASQEHGRS